LEKLDCHGNEFTSLDLSKNTKVVTLNCSSNNLTDLDLTNCESLQSVDMEFNQLSDVNFLEKLPSPEKLKILSLGFNVIDSDLNAFSRFTNLENLSLGTCCYGISNKDSQSQESKRENFNKFHGSLEFLKELSQLKKINISDTDIDGGLEFLPVSVKEIYCFSKKRSESRVKKIEEELSKDTVNFFFADNKKYVRKSSLFIEKLKGRIENLEKELDFDLLSSDEAVIEKKIKVNENLIKA
jgi:hypothetical protein